MSTTVRVSEATRDRFAKLAIDTGRPMTQLVEEAADALERRLFFARLAERFDGLRGDAEAWAEVEMERAIEHGSIADGSK
jgi:predicted transcriptional regulator